MISFTAEGFDVISRFKLGNHNIIPSSCHGLQWTEKNEIHLRLKIEDGGENVPLPSKTFSTMPMSSSLASRLNGEMVSLQCKMCGHCIVSSHRFGRVLPLPSDNWSSLRDDWFCHQHCGGSTGGEHQHKAPAAAMATQLRPKQDDLLIGETSVMVDRMHLQGVKNHDGGTVRCYRCRKDIGNQSGKSSEDAVKLYLNDIALLLNNEPILPPSVSLEASIANLILYQMQSYNAFRFIVESQTTPIILLWVLESRCVMYQGTVEGGQTSTLKPATVLKVLYRDCVRDGDSSSSTPAGSNGGSGDPPVTPPSMSSLWQRDLTVHSLSVPRTTALHLLQALVDSTNTLPRSTRRCNGFLVGYLRLEDWSVVDIR